MKPLKLVPANNTFGALQAVIGMLQDEHGLFITPAEFNGLMPEVAGLPSEVEPDVAAIVESSGTTGTPKRIELTTSALLASAKASADFLRGQGQWLLALPINFVAGLNVLVRSVVADTQPVMMNTQLPFTAEGFARSASLMTGEKRYTSLVPAQLARLAAQAEQDPDLFRILRSFDSILVGGQLPDFDLVERLRNDGVNLTISYGMTETCGGCFYNGLPIGDTALRLDGGLVSIAGSVLAKGFGPWHQTNDLGELIDERLVIMGRADRVIISGGIKLSLEVVEQFVQNLPGVEEAAAVALKSSWGESVGIAYCGSPEVDFSALANLGVAAHNPKILRLASLPKLQTAKPDLLAISELFND